MNLSIPIRKCICYHGTNRRKANSILELGFNPDTWFAEHLEDAIGYGGMHIFEVEFEKDKVPGWQFHVPERIPPTRIIGYRIFTRKTMLNKYWKRKKILNTEIEFNKLQEENCG